MKKVILPVLVAVLFVSACARDLSSNVYSSSSTLSLTLEGQIVAVRPIKIKEDSTGTGVLAGGALLGAGGSAVGGGDSAIAAAVIGGALIGGVLGNLIEAELGQQDGFEYIVKLDISNLKADAYEGSGAMRSVISAATTNGLVTIIQGNDTTLTEGQPVYAIFSEKRVRVIAK